MRTAHTPEVAFLSERELGIHNLTLSASAGRPARGLFRPGRTSSTAEFAQEEHGVVQEAKKPLAAPQRLPHKQNWASSHL